MSSLVEYLDNCLYPNVQGPGAWDDKLFRDRLLHFIKPNSIVLDIGAGAGIVAEMNFKGIADRVCGLDPDCRVLENPYLDEANIGFGECIPYPDSTFDIVFADNVLEHLSDPTSVFNEINRVLKPGGVFLAKTPNAWHYMPLISRITPISFHQYVNRLRGRAEVDTFPTCYAANSSPAIWRLAGQTGYRPVSIERIEGRPEYLRISAFTYILGWLYERLANSTRMFEPFRILLVIVLQKIPDSSTSSSNF